MLLSYNALANSNYDKNCTQELYKITNNNSYDIGISRNTRSMPASNNGFT